MTNESTESESSAPRDLTKRLEDLDDQRLAAMPDDDMVSIMVQRRYFADLRLTDKWKKQNKLRFRQLRFQRKPSR